MGLGESGVKYRDHGRLAVSGHDIRRSNKVASEVPRESVGTRIRRPSDSVNVRGEPRQVEKGGSRESGKVDVPFGTRESDGLRPFRVAPCDQVLNDALNLAANLLGRQTPSIGPELYPIERFGIDLQRCELASSEVGQGCVPNHLQRSNQRFVTRTALGCLAFRIRIDLAS